MLPPFSLKLSSQHRALYCYLILSVWIFLLVAGMYKYIGNEETSTTLKPTVNEIPNRNFPKNLKPDIKMRRIFKLCNPPEEIASGSEGQIHADFSLEGILIFLRHGDRGPLSHVRNITNVNCAGDLINTDSLDADVSFRSYESFLQNLSSPAKSATYLPQFLGPFQGFPLLPPSSGECQIGQMTPVGVMQLLKTGQILRSVYAERLGIGNGSLTSNDITVYSTRYRRTVQSAMAFLYSFLSSDDFQKVVLKESQSLAFCFNECACPSADRFRHKFSIESNEHFHSHPAVVKLVETAASIVFEMPDKTLASDPHALADALLLYVCHNAQLPCIDIGSNDKIPPEACIRMEQVTGLFAFTEWEARQYAKSINLKRSCLLRAYGLVRDIVSHMLRMISERKPKIVLYSGHDKTLQYLTTALGVISDTTVAPHYASRLIIEVYKSKEQNSTSKRTGSGTVARDYYFRLVFNGRDLTNHIHFCKGSNNLTPVQVRSDGSQNIHNSSLTPNGSRRQSTAYLCPIESIIRFLHDDYFSSFNATNFKDVCSVRS